MMYIDVKIVKYYAAHTLVLQINSAFLQSYHLPFVICQNSLFDIYFCLVSVYETQ